MKIYVFLNPDDTIRDNLVSPFAEVGLMLKQFYLSHNTYTRYSNWSENACTWRAGVSGNVLINDKNDRLHSYNVWDYAEGQDSYQKSMLVDLTQPHDKVNDLSSFY